VSSGLSAGPYQRAHAVTENGAMKVSVNLDRCEGYSRCMNAAPEVFEVREDDQSHVLIEQPGEELRSKVERAVRLCPRQAVVVVEEH